MNESGLFVCLLSHRRAEVNAPPDNELLSTIQIFLVALVPTTTQECITVQTFHKWWKDGGYARKWLYDDPWLNKACLIMEYLVKRIIVDNGMSSLFK